MIEAFGYFANTFADNMFIPMIISTLVCIGIGIVSWIQRDGDNKLQFGSHEYIWATGRMMASIQIAIIMWVTYFILSSVPGPDYNVKTVVEKTPIHSLYDDAYRSCDSRHTYADFNNDTYEGEILEHQFCDKQALEFVNMQPEVKIEVREKQVVRYQDKPQNIQYRDVFNTCMGRDLTDNKGWPITEMGNSDLSAPEMRNLRIEMCHKNAIEVINK